EARWLVVPRLRCWGEVEGRVKAHHLVLPRRNLQRIQGLLRYALKDRSCGLTTPFGAQRFINDDQNRQLRRFGWYIPDKGSQDLAVTVATTLDFLRCPGFASHRIALYGRLFACAALDHTDKNVVDAFHGLR